MQLSFFKLHSFFPPVHSRGDAFFIIGPTSGVKQFGLISFFIIQIDHVDVFGKNFSCQGICDNFDVFAEPDFFHDGFSCPISSQQRPCECGLIQTSHAAGIGEYTSALQHLAQEYHRRSRTTDHDGTIIRKNFFSRRRRSIRMLG